jgi:hypothetical protein
MPPETDRGTKAWFAGREAAPTRMSWISDVLSAGLMSHILNESNNKQQTKQKESLFTFATVLATEGRPKLMPATPVVVIVFVDAIASLLN